MCWDGMGGPWPWPPREVAKAAKSDGNGELKPPSLDRRVRAFIARSPYGTPSAPSNSIDKVTCRSMVLVDHQPKSHATQGTTDVHTHLCTSILTYLRYAYVWKTPYILRAWCINRKSKIDQTSLAGNCRAWSPSASQLQQSLLVQFAHPPYIYVHPPYSVAQIHPRNTWEPGYRHEQVLREP